MDRLTSQISLLVFLAFVTAQAFLWGSLYSVREAMDDEASEVSARRVSGRLETIQEQVSMIASDYHNWTDIYVAAQDLNYPVLSSNYGISADRGEIFQYAEIFDGVFPAPVGWQAGDGLIPQEGFLGDSTRTALRKTIASLDVTKRQTLDFFDVRANRLVIFSSSYLLPEDPRLLKTIEPSSQAIATIGKIVSQDILSEIGTEFSLSELSVEEEKTTRTTLKLPLVGVSEKPVAWLEWFPPTPGTFLFQKMAPIMAFLSLIIAGMFYWGAWLLRDRAARLITKEAISSKQARTDALTGLVNRFGLFERFADISSKNNLNCALLVMDMNNFKQINDTIGHIGGDSYLQVLGSRLQQLSDENAFVARVGGDEFMIVISSQISLEGIISTKCAQVYKLMSEYISYNGMLFECSAAKGGAMLAASSFCEKELMRRADVALYSAKKTGNQKIVFYDELMEISDRENELIESHLRLSLETGDGFAIAYQPIVEPSERNDISCYEALARWRTDELGQVPPDRFINVAENRGLIINLGWMLLDMICRDIRDRKSCRIAINISPIQLMSPNFADLFAQRVADHGICSEQIYIEITEQVVVQDEEKVRSELKKFREYGFMLALDDFGTGYASIGYLIRMPFNLLKIDRSFVRARTENMQAQRMIRSMMTLAHSMDLHVIVEGIETFEDAERFFSLGADYLQGYYFGRPAPLEEFPPNSLDAVVTVTEMDG